METALATFRRLGARAEIPRRDELIERADQLSAAM